MAKAKTLRVKMLAHLASPDPLEERLVGEEYTIPAAQAERFFDFGIAEIVEPGWKAREARGPEAYETATAAPAEISAPAAAESADNPPSDASDELRDAGDEE